MGRGIETPGAPRGRGDRTDYTAIVAELSAIRDALRALDAAWGEYVASGADALTPTRE